MTHIGGLWGALTCIAGGRKACLLEKFSVESWRDAIVRHRPEDRWRSSCRFAHDPRCKHPQGGSFASLVALRTGAAPLDFSDDQGIHGSLQSAGASELWRDRIFRCCRRLDAARLSQQFWDKKIGSVGRFQPGVDLARRSIRRPRAEMPAGEEGVLEMKSAQFGIGDEPGSRRPIAP